VPLLSFGDDVGGRGRPRPPNSRSSHGAQARTSIPAAAPGRAAPARRGPSGPSPTPRQPPARRLPRASSGAPTARADSYEKGSTSVSRPSARSLCSRMAITAHRPQSGITGEGQLGRSVEDPPAELAVGAGTAHDRAPLTPAPVSHPPPEHAVGDGRRVHAPATTRGSSRPALPAVRRELEVPQCIGTSWPAPSSRKAIPACSGLRCCCSMNQAGW